MIKHVKIYMKHHNYTKADIILCEWCSAVAVDVHHISRKGMGGSKKKDYPENLIALCRHCHNRAHIYPEFNRKLKLLKEAKSHES